MPVNAPSSPLRGVLDQQLSRLLEDFESQLVSQTRAAMGDSLNQALRRMRQGADAAEILGTLLDASTAASRCALVLRLEDGRAREARVRGVDAETCERFAALDIALADAPALAGAAESKDPVVTAVAAGEVSEGLAALLGESVTRMSVFPVVSAGEAKALLCCWGEDAQSGTLELLAQGAGLALPLPPPPPPPPAPEELIAIAPAVAPEEPAAAASEPESKTEPARARWEELPEEEQRIHLRAQRNARVLAAEIRLHHAEAVHAGRIHRDVYGALRDEIEAARGKFRNNFISACSSMVDYLHIELVRTLANDDLALMGSEFPPPMA
jgi:hypothetical protein